MELSEYKDLTARRAYLTAGTEAHRLMHRMAAQAQKITAKINRGAGSPARRRALFAKLIGRPVDEGFTLFPPFYTDFGKNISLGKRVFINAGCCFQDQGGIEIGDDCLIGHQVVLATLNHDPDPQKRGNMFPAPIRLGRRVWVGSHATILPGVTVGDNAIIAAGAVVTRDVPANAVAGGVPARILKTLPAAQPVREAHP